MTNNFQSFPENSVALVTASTGGIGKAVAQNLMLQGFNLIINGRNRERLEQTVQEFRGLARNIKPSIQIQGVAADLIEGNSCDLIFDALASFDGPLKAMFVNTPTPAIGQPESLNEDMWNHAYRAVIRFPDEIMRRAAENMADSGGGAIVVNSSCSATIPISPEFYLANTLRSASVSQAKTYARRYISQGVRINTLLTGYVDTSLVRNLADQFSSQNQQNVENLWSEWEKSIPIGRLAKADEIARVAAFLLSDEASYIVGAALEVDGGISMRHQNF